VSLFRRIFGSSRQSVVLGKTDGDTDAGEAKRDQQEPEPPAPGSDRVEPSPEERSDER
jgi:hypothetical protein